MFIEFVGDWKQLKPMGFTFQRLYAANYICYHKKDLNIWIWKKGKTLELLDLYGRSYLILQYLVQNNFNVQSRFNRYVIDFKLGIVEPHEYLKHEPSFEWTKLPEAEHVKLCEEHYKRYRTVHLKPNMIAALQELYLKGLIKLTKKAQQ